MQIQNPVALHYTAKCKQGFCGFPPSPVLRIVPSLVCLGIPSSADALLILSDAASLSVAPSNQSSSRIRLPKLPAHISPWEQQQ